MLDDGQAAELDRLWDELLYISHEPLMLLGAWGTPGADLNDDGTTDTQDVLMLLAAWGTAG